jgi:hypothetical protein
MEDEQLRDVTFSHEEIGEIIETASRLDQLDRDRPGLDRREVEEVAAELGISERAIEAAIEAKQKERSQLQPANDLDNEQREAAARRRRRSVRDWKTHAVSYVGTISGLAAIDVFTGDGFDWFFIPAAAWGIGFSIHSLMVLLKIDTDYSRDSDG